MANIAHDNLECLEQALQLLKQIPAETFRQREAFCFNSSIGEHLRHNLDHYRSFLDGLSNGRVNYDHRSRDQSMQEKPEIAVAVIQDILKGLSNIDENSFDLPLVVRMDSGGDEESPWSSSTVRRELQFLLSHSIHHYALIATICQLQGLSPSPSFGIAPSTLRHRRKLAKTENKN